MSEDTFTAVNRYVVQGGSYYDPLVSASIGGEDRFHLFDGLGSTRQLLDSDEDVTDSYSYEAFGNVLSDGGTTPNPYRYVGSLGYYQIYPPEAGEPALMHLGARYYMPGVGSFIQRDPLRAFPDRYAYVGHRPTAQVDPPGMSGSRSGGGTTRCGIGVCHSLTLVPVAGKAWGGIRLTCTWCSDRRPGHGMKITVEAEYNCWCLGWDPANVDIGACHCAGDSIAAIFSGEQDEFSGGANFILGVIGVGGHGSLSRGASCGGVTGQVGWPGASLKYCRCTVRTKGWRIGERF